MACCGDVPTMEALAAVCLLRERIPDLRIRVVNVVDLMALQPTPSIRTACPTRTSIGSSRSACPSSSPSTAIRGSFTASLIAATITTTSTCAATRKKAPPPRPSTCACSTTSTASNSLSTPSAACRVWPRRWTPHEQWYSEAIQRHKLYVAENGDDLPEIKDWRWPK